MKGKMWASVQNNGTWHIRLYIMIGVPPHNRLIAAEETISHADLRLFVLGPGAMAKQIKAQLMQECTDELRKGKVR